MPEPIPPEGFFIIPSLLDSEEISHFRTEANHLSKTEGKACVRRALEKSPAFAALSTDPRIQNYLGNATRPVRSLLFDKTPEENWPVPWHQDLTIAVAEQKDLEGYGPWSVKEGVPHVQPPREILDQMLTARIHLDDTPAENGALRIRLPDGSESTCACEAGDVLFMRPTTFHASSRSEKPGHRRVLHIEFAPEGILHPELRWSE